MGKPEELKRQLVAMARAGRTPDDWRATSSRQRARIRASARSSSYVDPRTRFRVSIDHTASLLGGESRMILSCARGDSNPHGVTH
jgi:hypothetical protein